MKTLHIMGLDFTYKAAIRGYESAIVTRVWNGIGSLQITINSGIPNADLIAEDDIIWFDNDYHKAHIVETIDESLEGSQVLYRIKANHINTLLRDFITVPPSGSAYHAVTGTREAVVRAWVDSNVINPTDSSRAQYPIVLGTLQGLGSSITEQTRYKPLDEEVSRILLPQDLGWSLDLDIPNNQFVFNVAQGMDRTAGQSVNNRILFGLKFGNLARYRKVKDSAAAKTVAYVGGQGEGDLRTIVKVDSSGSGRKKETFVDARDTDVSAELTERGTQVLTEAASINSYEFEVLNRQFTYETDYDLGDFVTIVIDKDSSQDMQIKRITEVYEKGNIKVIPEFGKLERTMSDVITGLRKQLYQSSTK